MERGFLDKELVFSAVKSSGPGGQHVNKASTKIELRFDVANSDILSEEDRSQILEKLKKQISKEGILRIVSQESRSQATNKEQCREKFYDFLEKALKKEKPRLKIKLPEEINQKRLEQKKRTSEIKNLRKKLRP